MMPKYNDLQQANRLMPDSKIFTNTSPRTLNDLYDGTVAFRKNPSSLEQIYPWADRFVCGMPLAPWQRPVVWNADMQSRFIFVGKYGHETCYLSDIVIDGQQRLTIIERYFNGEIPATAIGGRRLLSSETTDVDRRFFKNRIFTRTSVNTNDEQLLREAYDMRAFGGIRHTEDQRAVRKENR